MNSNMNKYKDAVPFDPGYSNYYVDFYLSVAPLVQEIYKLKAMQKKKFKLSIVQSRIKELLNKSTAFYLGCLLWASYISNRFKDYPKKILDNPSLDSPDNTIELSKTIEYFDLKTDFIKKLDKDYHYFLKSSLLEGAQVLDILGVYKEFIILNSNFVSTKLTSEVKLPEKLSYFSELSNDELDSMEQKIFEIINSGQIETLMDIGFYKLG